MKERPASELDYIQKSLHPISEGQYFMESERREAEAEIGWFVSSAVMLHGETIPLTDTILNVNKRYGTEVPLKGMVRKLSRRTLVAVMSYRLPLDMSDNGLNEYLKPRGDMTQPARQMGFVALNEPGAPILRPTKTKAAGYFEIPDNIAYEPDTVAAIGLSNYLNLPGGIHTMSESAEELRDSIDLAYGFYGRRREQSRLGTTRALQRAMGSKIVHSKNKNSLA